MTGAEREAMRGLLAENLACVIIAFEPTADDTSGVAGDIAQALDRYADAVAAPLHGRIAALEAENARLVEALEEARDLLRRAAVGLQRHCEGRSAMRIPADVYGDSDIVLDAIRGVLAAYEAQR